MLYASRVYARVDLTTSPPQVEVPRTFNLAGALVAESGTTRICPLNAALGIDTTAERMQDFRTEINDESDRIKEAYAKHLTTDNLVH